MSTLMRVVVITLILVAGVGGLAYWLLWPADGDAQDQEQPTAIAKEGPLTISVTESGTIKAREQEVIKSRVEGQTTILFLVPEGSRVKEGDLLVELDTSNLQDRLVEQEIQVKNSETSFIRARENLEVVKKQAESDIALATRDHRFAEEDLKQYVEGEFPKLLKEANSRITLEKEELENSEEKYEWSKQLFTEKYISESELEADRLARNRSELDHDLAVANRDLLKDYTYKRKVDELESNIEETQRAFERVKLSANSDVIQAQADLDNRKAELDRQHAKQAKLEDQIKKAKIVSPGSGMVVYATSSRASWRGNDEPLDEGQTVRERQELIHLPTTDAMKVELKVHESNLKKIELGLAVQVRVDAIPGKVYVGRISKIAPLPDAQSMWMNPDLKVYRTEVQLDSADEALRTGMSCQCEVLIEHYDEAIYVPVQAVVRPNGDPVVYVSEGESFAPRSVKIGKDNNRVVVIEEGLKAGEVVSLTPPLHRDTMVADGDGGAQDASAKAAIAAAKKRQQEDPVAKSDSGESGSSGGERGNRGGGGRGNWAERMKNMSPEEIEKMRERFRNMSPEDRAKMRGGSGRSGRPSGSGESGRTGSR